MQRWNAENLLETGLKLFHKIHRRKQHCNHNHDVHFLAREIDDWLPQGVQSLLEGCYTPRMLKRLHLESETIDTLHITDRIMQHLILRVLKTTFKFVMSSNCYHLNGPNGVTLATQEIKSVLAQQKPQYYIRADIRSFYKSMMHHILIKDIKQHYSDPKLIKMLSNVIENPVDTPNGFTNPINGVALRGPLSQFFSALYLLPLDKAFEQMDVTYLRYQDDIVILCKSKRQMLRARQHMMRVLQERRLSLSKRKTKMGAINKGFHFLGVDYLSTQPIGNTTTAQTAQEDKVTQPTNWGGCLLVNRLRFCGLSRTLGHYVKLVSR